MTAPAVRTALATAEMWRELVTLPGTARASSSLIFEVLCSYSTLSFYVSLSPYSVLQPCCNQSRTGQNSAECTSELECRKPLS